MHDPHGRSRLVDVGQEDPLFLTERQTPYSLKDFYYHWYRHSTPLQAKCPVRFSPHDLRHLFVTEYLIKLKKACGAGTEQFDAEKYQSSREAFGRMIMAWRSPQTIDIYDQSREGEAVFSVLAGYQHDLSQRRSAIGPPLTMYPSEQRVVPEAGPQPERRPNQDATIVWMHDEETLNWIKSMEQQAGP